MLEIEEKFEAFVHVLDDVWVCGGTMKVLLDLEDEEKYLQVNGSIEKYRRIQLFGAGCEKLQEIC